jgi:RNA recognition motif-containing protein
MGIHKIYVKGLPWLASEAEVRDFFKACGKISSVELPMGDDGRSTGTAFVVFSLRSELEKAIELDGQYWPGTERWLKIQEGFEKPERKNFGIGVRPEGCDTVFVGNLPFDVEEDQLREVFALQQVLLIEFASPWVRMAVLRALHTSNFLTVHALTRL